MLRKLALLFLGISVAGFAFVLSPSLRAAAQNVACSFAQGGATFNAGSGCTIALASGSGITLATGSSITGTGAVVLGSTLAIPNGSAPAATCIAGQIFLDTDETVDTNCTTTNDNSLCLCVATDTWVQLNNN